MKGKLIVNSLGLFIMLAMFVLSSSSALAASHSPHATARPQSATRPSVMKGDDCGIPDNTMEILVRDLSTGNTDPVCFSGTGYGGAKLSSVLGVSLMNGVTVGWFRWYSPAHPEGNYCTLSEASGGSVSFPPSDTAAEGVLITQVYTGAPAPGSSFCG